MIRAKRGDSTFTTVADARKKCKGRVAFPDVIPGCSSRGAAATLRDRLRSGDVWIERTRNYQRFDEYLLPPADVTTARRRVAGNLDPHR